MQRYQIYLNPSSVSTLDELESLTNITRSKVIRELVDKFVNGISKVISAKKLMPQKKYVLDELIGIIDTKGGKQTDYASRDDDIYLIDKP